MAPSFEMVTFLPSWINLSMPRGPIENVRIPPKTIGVSKQPKLMDIGWQLTESRLDDIDNSLARVDVRNDLATARGLFRAFPQDHNLWSLENGGLVFVHGDAAQYHWLDHSFTGRNAI